MTNINFRSLKLQDAQWLIEINDEEVRKYLLNLTFQENKRFTVKDEEEWIKNKIKDKNSDTIVVLYNGEPAGIGELQFKKTHAVIGLWIRKKFWRKGLCKELVKKLLNV